MTVHVDQNYLPLIRVSYDGLSTDAEFEAHLETLRASMMAKDATPRVLVIDATRSDATPPTQRRRQAEWMQENAALIRRLTVGCAFVIPSPMVRGFLTAIFWIQPLPCPHAVCGTLEEALEWGEGKIRERDIAFPLGARTAWLPRRAASGAR